MVDDIVRALAATALASGDSAVLRSVADLRASTTLAPVSGLQQPDGSLAGSRIVTELVRSVLQAGAEGRGVEGGSGGQQRHLQMAFGLPVALSALQPGVGLIVMDLLLQEGDLQVGMG